MIQTIIDYLLEFSKSMHFEKVPEQSDTGIQTYRLLSDYGNGTFKIIRFDHDLLFILIADFTPNQAFENTTEISENYIEVSQFETNSSSFKIGGGKKNQVEKGIHCFINTQSPTFTYCEVGKPVRFTKIILSYEYFDAFFKSNGGRDYRHFLPVKDYIMRNPNLPELNFVFQQIRNCEAKDHTLKLYIESKVMELVSLVIKGMEQEEMHLSVRLDHKDIHSLKKTITFMKKDLSAYPTGNELAKIAGMSIVRYHLTFRKYYGTTPYEYLKEMRLNQASLLLKDSDYKIAAIAARIGYHHSGHFAHLFKESYGLEPRTYRKMYRKKQ